ncbi:MAG: hypothetical protein WD960_01185 [Gemmatimonadota bacterium]
MATGGRVCNPSGPGILLHATVLMAVVGMVGATGCDLQLPSQDAVLTEPLFDAEVREVWRAGGTEERGDLVLEGLWAAAFGPGDHVAISDHVAGQLFLVGPQGNLVETVGRPGIGPGEFQALREVGFIGDSLLWASDDQTGNLAVFSPSGDLIRTIPRPREPIPRSPWSVAGRWLLRDGAVVGHPVGGAAGETRGDILPVPLAFWDSEGAMEVIDWLDRPGPTNRQIPTSRGTYVSSPQPLSGAPIVGIAGGGDWFFVLDRKPAETELGRVDLRRFDTSGVLIDELEIPYRSHPVDDEVMEWIEGFARVVEAQLPASVGAVTAQDVVDATWIPSRLPPVREALADSSGFWLMRERAQPGIWERYDLDGNLLARVELDSGFQGLASDVSYLVGYGRDELNVPVLYKYSVTMVPATD